MKQTTNHHQLNICICYCGKSTAIDDDSSQSIKFLRIDCNINKSYHCLIVLMRKVLSDVLISKEYWLMMKKKEIYLLFFIVIK